jgi:Fur family peroxide stress response transcriptional regulator
MNSNYERLSRRIKEEGYRMTKQRAVVLEELSKADFHPRADEIYQMVRRRLPKISFGTVYRNLKTLKDLGFISELNYGKNFSRFEAKTENHHHFVCMKCGKVYDIDADKTPVEMCNSIAEKAGYKVSYYRLEFYGICCAEDN